MIVHGPKPVNRNRQIAIPAELMNTVGLQIGDQVYLAQHEELPEAIVVVPIEVVTRWLDAGRRALSGTESPDDRSAGDDRALGEVG